MPTAKSKKKRNVNVWMIVSIILIILFAAFILYEKSPNIHNGVNMILGIESDRYPILEQVRVDVLSDKSITDASYDYNEILNKIEDEFEMEFVITEVDVNDEKGGKYISDFELAAIPVLLFEENLATTKLYEETKDNYKKQGDKYILQLQPYKYLTLPSYETGHKRGSENPKVTIVEYSSLSCGYCGKMHPILLQLLEEYPNDVQFIYKHFNRGGMDMFLENATECAAEQDKFWEMHDYIFDNQESLFDGKPEEVVNDGAAVIGVDMEQFNICVEEQKYAQTVNEHTAEGYKFGVNGTPSFFVNDIFIGGAVSYETLKQTIDSFIQ